MKHTTFLPYHHLTYKGKEKIFITEMITVTVHLKICVSSWHQVTGMGSDRLVVTVSEPL